MLGGVGGGANRDSDMATEGSGVESLLRGRFGTVCS